MNNPLVSIIMPVYKVEKYLEAAVNSILNQSYPHFELLLVDDCSPDGSPAICDSLAASDNRIKVIHKPQNEGVSLARNTGLDNATGDYILFVDSDDTIEPDLIEKAVRSCNKDTEMLVFGFNRNYEDEHSNIIKVEKLTPFAADTEKSDTPADIFIMLSEAKMFQYIWNRLYKRSFIEKHGTRFENIKPTEDFLFNIELFKDISHITVIPKNLYNYRKPPHETLTSAYSPIFYDISKRKYLLEKEYLISASAFTEKNRQVIYASHIKHIISTFLKNHSKNSKLSPKEQKEKIRQILNDELTIEVLNNIRPDGIIMKVITKLLKSKSVFLCYMFTVFGGIIL
ncbi:MAG: glycosyltransferase family 2 protein [Clostridia bacterium]|nr:glycosyltransferase family 2 protein [Clostridia bacterium]